MKSDTSQSIVELLDCWKICLRAPLLVLNFKTRWTRERWLRHERVSTRMQTTFKKTTASSKRSNSQVSNESQIHIVTWWFLQWSASCPLEFSFSLVATGFTDFTITSIDLFTSDSEIQRKFLFVLFCVSFKNRSNLFDVLSSSLFASKTVDLSSEVKVKVKYNLWHRILCLEQHQSFPGVEPYTKYNIEF